jgi:hypothetical protein
VHHRLARAVIATEVERLINALDLIDGDCDLEPEELEPSEEHTGGEGETEDNEESEM